MFDYLKRFVRDEDGATMVEYGIMVALIAVVCITIIIALGIKVNAVFGALEAEMP